MVRLAAALALAPFCIGIACATVNVNTAQQSELQRVKGLDKSKAKAIIDYRNANGHYRTLDDLAKVPGMSRDTLTRISADVTFTGDSYVGPVKVAQKGKGKDKEKEAAKPDALAERKDNERARQIALAAARTPSSD